LKAINAGRMAATIAQQPKVMGALAVRAASTLLKGGTVAKFTPVPLRLVTKSP
jgi:ribose transport system substrate-binding protein